MTRLVLQLSAADPVSLAFDCRPDDIVLVQPNALVPLEASDQRQLRSWPCEGDFEASRALVEALAMVDDESARSVLRAYLNEYFSYAVAPLLALIEQVQEILSAENVSEIVVLASDSPGPLPNFGFRTAELSRGSPNLLYGRIASFLPQIFADMPMTFHRGKPDILSRPWVRVPLLRLASAIFQIVFSIKLLFFSSSRPTSPAADQVKNLVIHRAQPQSKHVEGLGASPHGMTLAILGQLQSLDRNELRRLDRQQDPAIPRATVNFRDLWKAYCSSRADLRAVRRFARKGRGPLTLTTAKGELSLDLVDLAREITLFPAPLLYKGVLAALVGRLSPRKLVGFELVGRAASFEAEAARAANARVEAIQVATIANRAHPIFPFADIFHADSPETARYLSTIAPSGDGKVRYSGAIEALAPPQIAGKIERIALFTQPYETTETLALLEEVCGWAVQNDAKVCIRPHPRDDASYYMAILARFGETAFLDTAIDASEKILWSQVCITRTSSVAKAALAKGRPPLICLLSDFDRGIDMDMIKPHLRPSCIVNDAPSIRLYLDAPDEMVAAALLLQEAIFGNEAREVGAARDFAGQVLAR